MAKKVDIFSIWGVPSDAILKGMSARQIKLLKSYIEGTTVQAYRTGYDNGFVEGLCKISSTAAKELNRQRDRMARSVTEHRGSPVKRGLQMSPIFIAFLVIVAIVCLAGMLSDGSRPAEMTANGPTDRDLELAALHNLDLPFSSEFFPKPDAELDRTQEWIDKKREWLLTVEDRRVRKAYAHWIDYAQTRLNDNRQENRTHKEQLAYEARRKARDEEWSRGRAAANTIPKPQ